MTGQVARILTCAALTFAVSGWARAQEAPAAVVPPAALPSEEAERALVTAPVVIDGRAVLHVRGVASFPAGERAGLIAERIEAAARDTSVPLRVEKTPAPEGIRLHAGSSTLLVVTAADGRLEGVEPDVLASLFVDRGVKLERTYQLNFGGNTDFLNMLERERLESKKISKTNAVTSMLPYELPAEDVHVGPSDHVPWLTDRKWCYVRMEGTTFGDASLNLEAKLEVWDSPNSAGVIIDAVRCVKIAMDRGLSGPIIGPSAYFMKTPPKQFKDSVAREMTEAFIQGES